MPVYNVERYLRQCLDSIVAQTLQGIEVIVVNDGSTDSSLQILEEYQSKYPELFKIYTTENQGVSHARNYGMTKASGEYIQFVDSDDYIEKDMCEKLYTKAVQDDNDLVICARYNVFEREHVGQVKRELIPTDLLNHNFVLSENKFELAHILPFPWDKLYRRSLLEGMEFPEKMRFEDLAFVYKVVCKARHIGVVEEPLYNYRKTTQGGFLNTFSKQTLDIIKAFELVFDYYKKNQLMDYYHDELEFICARHFLYRYVTLFKKENRGKMDIKLEIINRTQDFLDRELPNWRNNRYLKYSSGWLAKRLPLFTNRRKMILLTKLREHMPERIYKLVTRFRKMNQSLSRKLKKFMSSKSKMKLITGKLPGLKILAQKGSVYYTKVYEKLPVDPRVILLESKHGEDVAGNIFALLKELSREEYSQYRVLLSMEQEYIPRYAALFERYDINNVTMLDIRSKEYAKALASAKYLITDTSFPTYFIKKPEQVYLNTWHGTPLKAMGRIVPEREYALGNVQRNFLISDYLLYQNDFSAEVFLRDYMLKDIYPGTVLVSGYPRNSLFFSQKRYFQIRKECGLQDKQVIVYMPTWRGLLHKKETAKQLEQLGIFFDEIDKGLTDNQIFYVKLHPYVKNQVDYSIYQHIKGFPEEYETYDFLNASDVLVTDYSSIMFDYGVTRRKIILFTYDREEYLKGRGLYLDLDTLELPKVDTVPELLKELGRECSGYPQFYERFCSCDRADTPKRICELLFDGKEDSSGSLNVRKTAGCGKKKVFLYIKGLKNDDYSRRLIKLINSMDTDKYNVFVCMKESNVKKNTAMLSQLKKEISYFPILFKTNYTRADYILCKFCLRFGIGGKAARTRLEKVARREIRKFFGAAEFDYVIHHSELDRMAGLMCSLMGKKTVYNFKYFNYDTYRDRGSYRKQVRFFAKRFGSYDIVVATKEHMRLKHKASNILLNEDVDFPMDLVLKELDS